MAAPLYLYNQFKREMDDLAFAPAMAIEAELQNRKQINI